MPRQGKEFEELIMKLEKLFLPTDAIITSPDNITDKITGGKREVDISIKHKYGTSEYLTIIECRDRSSTQDVTWIEQLHTKGKDIGADKTIAVSKGGFTQPALVKAKMYGIEMRTYGEIDDEILKDWFPTKLIIFNQNYNIKNVKMLINRDDDQPTVIYKLSEKVLLDATNNHKFSIKEIIDILINQHPYLWDSVKDNGEIYFHAFNLKRENSDNNFRIADENGDMMDIMHLYIGVEFWKNIEIPNNIGTYQYKDEKSEFVKIVEYPATDDYVLQIITTEDGSISLTSRKNSK